MRSAPDDQLILRATNHTHPELVGVLPREWDITANNGFHGKYNKKYTTATEEDILGELSYVGMLHFNGGGTSDEAYFKEHPLVKNRKHEHSFGLIQYYANMPWSWARFMVESNIREGISFAPQVVTEVSKHAGAPFGLSEDVLKKMVES